SHGPTIWLGNVAFPRIESLFHDANLLAIYLLIGVLIIIYLLLGKRLSGLNRLLLVLLLVVHLAGIVVTVSRSGILLFAFSLSLLIPRMLGNRVIRLLLFMVLIGTALVLLLALSFPISITVASDYFDAYRSRFTLEDETIRI